MAMASGTETNETLSDVTAKEGACDTCLQPPAVMSCIDCKQKLCDPCSKSHKSIKGFENHQVVELGSFCDLHPTELIKMYCYEDNIAICLTCFVENHHSHRCADIDKAAAEFTEQLKEDTKTVTNRLTECEKVDEKLNKYENELKEQIDKAGVVIPERGIRLKTLIDEQTELLIQQLKSAADRNSKAFENTRQDVDRFKELIESYSKKSEELLAQGSLFEICRVAAEMHARATELENLPANFSGDSFSCDSIVFCPSAFEGVCCFTNALGELNITESSDRVIQFEIDSSRKQLHKLKSAFDTGFSTVKVSGIPRNVSKDTISLYFGNQKLSGGGKHTVLEHDVEEGKAIIKFDIPQDALNVCMRRHLLCGAVLRISALEMLLHGIRGCVNEAKKGQFFQWR